MFLLTRPSTADIERFLDRSQRLPLSYGPSAIAGPPSPLRRVDDEVTVIGHGDADFEHACAALARWQHFEIGWVEIFPRHAAIDAGTVVAVLIRHLGFWSLNGARVLYRITPTSARRACGFAYGTLTNHAESGEELFEVSIDPQSGDVMYRIRAVSWPQSPLAVMGYPMVRILQARFRRDCAAAMKRAVAALVEHVMSPPR
jgi:uncharacterized protein (UPF0548 family)